MTMATWNISLRPYWSPSLPYSGVDDGLRQQVRRDDPGQVVQPAQLAHDGRQRGGHDRLVQRREEHAQQQRREDQPEPPSGDVDRCGRCGRRSRHDRIIAHTAASHPPEAGEHRPGGTPDIRNITFPPGTGSTDSHAVNTSINRGVSLYSYQDDGRPAHLLPAGAERRRATKTLTLIG
jgi:hypothetical protein